MITFQKITRWGLVAVTIFLTFSCEYDSDLDNYHEREKLPDEISIGVNLANVAPGDTIYMYGSTYLFYETITDVGTIKSISFTLDGITQTDENSSGYISIYPQDADDRVVKTLKMDIGVKGNNGSMADEMFGLSYLASLEYKLKYIKITADDFAMKKAEVDKMTFAMVNKNDSPCRYVINGKVIGNLDNIEISRAGSGHFPSGVNAKIYIVPDNISISDYEQCYYIDFWLYDNHFENYPFSCVSFLMDKVHRKMYSSYGNHIYVYDENMNFIAKKEVDASYIAVTPTGLITCYSYGKIITYTDDSFSSVVSTINNAFHKYAVSGRDQLFWANNFQVDAFNLRTGELIYSIQNDSYDSVTDVCATEDGEYLYIQYYNSNTGKIYQLADNSATLLYTIDKTSWDCFFHPVNENHLILDRGRNGFEIYDIESRQTVFSNKGELQSIDPITGNMIYYDENYSYEEGKAKNIFVDKDYQQIYVLDNNTRGTCGPLQLFNNYIFKSTSYVDISSKLSK